MVVGNLGNKPILTGTIVGLGGTGGGDAQYVFTQNVVSNTWNINHQLNKYPSITVVDSGKNVVIGDIQYVDKNNAIVTFSAPFSGYAYCN